MSTAATHFDSSDTLLAGTVASARPVPEAPALGLKGKVARSVLARIVRKVDVGLALPSGEHFGPRDPRLPQLRVLDEEAFFGRPGDSPMIGLGEAYMAGEWDTTDDTDLTVPRRDQARTRIPAGSVGLAGAYSGVYPSASPGGWQLIGSTELAMWDPTREEPALLAPGRTVRFEEIR